MPQTTDRRQFESLTQAAERTGLSTRTLHRRIAAGDLAAYRAGPRTDSFLGCLALRPDQRLVLGVTGQFKPLLPASHHLPALRPRPLRGVRLIVCGQADRPGQAGPEFVHLMTHRRSP